MKRPYKVSTIMFFILSFMLFLCALPTLPTLLFYGYVNGDLEEKFIAGIDVIPSVITFMMKLLWDVIVAIDGRCFGFLTCLKLIINSILSPKSIVRTRLLGFPRRWMMLSSFQFNASAEKEYSLTQDLYQDGRLVSLKRIEVPTFFGLDAMNFVERFMLKIYDRGKLLLSNSMCIIKMLWKLGFTGMIDLLLLIGNATAHDFLMILRLIFVFITTQCISIQKLGMRRKFKDMQYAFKTILNLDVRMPFDTDSIDMVMDNSANVFICNNKSLPSCIGIMCLSY